MKVVLDSNIYISGLALPKSLPGKILILAKERKIEVYCSRFILEEIKKNLIVKFGYSEEIGEKFIKELLKFVKVIKPKITISAIKEKEDDNRILECACEARVDYLISGDKKHILPLKKIKKSEILSAREFLESAKFR